MNKVCLKVLTILFFIIFSFQSVGVLAANADGANVYEKKKEVIVMFKNEKGKEAILQKSKDVIYEFETISALSVLLIEGDINSLLENPDIAHIEVNEEVELLVEEFEIISSEDELFQRSEESQWSIQAMGMKDAWNEGYEGERIKIGIIDTGIAPHRDLHIAGGVSMVDYTTSWQDDHGHGTHVAGIIGAKRNGMGMIGVAPKAELYAIKSMNNNGTGTLQSVYRGIDWAIQNNMDIINLSISVKNGTIVLGEMLNEAYEKDIIIVSGTGNEGLDDGSGNTVAYPAKYDKVIAVSAVDRSLNRAEFSSTGREVDFSAPGKFIASTFLNNQYALGSGTSMSSPHIAGFIAILKQLNPAMSNEELRQEMIKYAQDLGEEGKDHWYGYGFINYAFDNDYEIPKSGDKNENPSEIGEELQKKLEDARELVKLAERKRKLQNITLAEEILVQLPELKEKQELLERIKIVINTMIEYAYFQVDMAESDQTLFSIDTAERAVEELKEGQEKMSLQERINVIKNKIGLVDFGEKVDIQPLHNWTIKFNKPIDSSTASEQFIYVKHESRSVDGIEVLLNENRKSVTLSSPIKGGYKNGETYFIYIEKGVKSSDGEELQSPIVMKFIVAE